MKLHGNYTSPFVRHCRIAMAQENIEFEFVDTSFAKSMEMSPTGKMPFLKDNDLTLTDSASILKYIREQSGKAFLQDILDFELFTLTNTLMDSNVNLFLLSRDGVDPDQTPYLSRQRTRIQSGIKALNRMIDPAKEISTDGQLRCACYVDWTSFRNLVDYSGLDNLQALRDSANQLSVFTDTAPPA